MTRPAPRLTILPVLLILTGCAVGPDYHRPAFATPATFKEAAIWQPAQSPNPAMPEPHGDWWKIYGDAQLDELIPQLLLSNQNIAAAAAQLRQTQALLEAANSARFPVLGASLSGTRASSPGAAGSVSPANAVKLALNASWEPDLWGRIGRNVEAGQASVQASKADLDSARLSAQLTLAQTVFQLRVADAQRALLAQTIKADERSLEITRNRQSAGVASRLDVVQAETQLESARAQASDMATQRARLEHAIALLTGKTPAELSLAAITGLPALPPLPEMLPAALLERRPDIAAAERRVAAANAAIGISQAAWFPSLTFNASGGYQNNSLSRLLTQPHRFWSLGPSLALTIFDGDARSAEQAGAMAAYDKTVALYRQVVLTAFQEVEDNLATLNGLHEEIASQTRATRSADEALKIAETQYRAGVVSYLNVVTAQTTALTARRALITLQGQILSAHAMLLKTFAGDFPSRKEQSHLIPIQPAPPSP